MNLGFMLVIKCLSKLHPWPLVVYNFCVNTQLKKNNDKAQGYHNQAFQFHSNDLWENTIRKKKYWRASFYGEHSMPFGIFWMLLTNSFTI